MGGAERVGGVVGVVEQVRALDGRTQTLPQRLVARGDDDLAVGGGEGGERRDRGVPAAQRLRVLAGGPGPRQGVFDDRHRRVLHRQVEIAALPRLSAAIQRTDDADDRVECRNQIADRRAHAHRRAAFRPGQPHQPGRCLDDDVVGAVRRPGTKLPEAREAAIDEPGIAGAEGSVAEAQPVQRTRPKVFQQHVGLLRQPPRQVETLGLLQIERQPCFALVDADEVQRVLAGERAEAAGLIAAGWLDLDDPSAQLR